MTYLLLTEMGLLMKPPGCQLLKLHTKVKCKRATAPRHRRSWSQAGDRLGAALWVGGDALFCTTSGWTGENIQKLPAARGEVSGCPTLRSPLFSRQWHCPQESFSIKLTIIQNINWNREEKWTPKPFVHLQRSVLSLAPGGLQAG